VKLNKKKFKVQVKSGWEEDELSIRAANEKEAREIVSQEHHSWLIGSIEEEK